MTDAVASPVELKDLRKVFPVLDQHVGNYPLTYLDSAATTQKPLQVIEAISRYYLHDNANIHRGVHHLATRATEAFEQSRETVRQFIGAKEKEEVIFTSGTTESINLVAQTLGRTRVQAGDEILVSHLEHHSNIVPWQMLCEERSAVLRVIPVTDPGEWDLSSLDDLITERTRIVAVNHVSNALGTINPVREVIRRAHQAGALVLIDGAQAVAHFPVDVTELGCDFYCFSGHKVYGPTGSGILYGRREILQAMPPWKGGGEMIREVRFSGTTYNDPPYRFEAGTPHIAGAIGLGEAIRFVQSIGWRAIGDHEQGLLLRATELLRARRGIRIYGESASKVGVISFICEGVHPYDLGTLLDQQGVAVRTGHHCTQPLWERYGIEGTVRISLAAYSTQEDLERFEKALDRSIQMLSQ